MHKSENGSCVATFLEEAGTSSVKAADYEATYMYMYMYTHQGPQVDSISPAQSADENPCTEQPVRHR